MNARGSNSIWFRAFMLMIMLGLCIRCGGTDTGNPSKNSEPTNTGTPLIGCHDDVFVCPGGSQVTRDPANGCQFRPCP